MVVVAHVHQIWIQPLTGISIASIILGEAATLAVCVFFVLSGFLIAASARRRCQAGRFDASSFIIARAIRIFPPLFAAVAVTFASFAIIRWLHLYGSTSYTMPGDLLPARDQAVFETGCVVPTLTLAYGLGYGSYLSFDGPLWSLGYEWWLYVCAALVLMMILNRSIAAAVGLAAIYYFARPNPLWPMFAAAWAIGFALGWRLRKPSTVAASQMIAIGLLVVAVAEWQARGIVDIYGTGSGKLVYIASALAIGGALMLLPVSVSSISGRALSQCGRFSYTLYLVHFPLLMLVFSAIRPAIFRYGIVGHAAAGGAAFVLAIFASSAIASLVEDRSRFTDGLRLISDRLKTI